MRTIISQRAHRLAAVTLTTYLAAFPTVARSASIHDSAPRIQQLHGEVAALAILANELIAGGNFTSSQSGGTSYRLARWSRGWQPFVEQPDGPVKALAVMRGQLIVGGEFEYVGSMPADHLATWDGSNWSTLAGGTNGPVYALHVQGDYVLYVGGAFTEADGRRMHSVAKWTAGAWLSLGTGLDGQVNALAVHQGNLIAGGDFHISPIDPYELNLARLVGDEWHSIARGIDGSVSTLLVWNGALVAAGDFLRIDFVTPAHRLAALRSDVWNPLGFGFGDWAGLDGTGVHALGVHDGSLVAGGSFTVADLKTANFIARFDGLNWWAVGSGTNGSVETLFSQGDVLYAGGLFDEAGGSNVGAVAGFRGVDWIPLEAVPVVVENLVARATPAGVELQWHLATSSLASIVGVTIEKSTTILGPFETCSAVSLAPAAHMRFLDPVSPAESPARFYRLVLADVDGGTSFAGPVEVERVVTRTRLRAPQEAVADGSVALGFELSQPGTVRLGVYDVRGRRLASWAAIDRPAGSHVQFWDRRDAAGVRVHRGLYLVRLEAGGARDTRKLVLRHE